eukprot:3544381-Amphidinium_carterae.1
MHREEVMALKIIEASQDGPQLIVYMDGAVEGEFSGSGAVLALPGGQVRIIKREVPDGLRNDYRARNRPSGTLSTHCGKAHVGALVVGSGPCHPHRQQLCEGGLG